MADEKVKEKKDKKKKKEPGKARRWFKDFFSELKKVTWPSFGNVLKQTGIVLLVTIIFLLVMMAFDAVLGLFHSWLISRVSPDEAAAAVMSMLRASGGGLLW